MAKQLSNGQTSYKVSPSWCLAYRMEWLRDLLLEHPAISFHHVRREANKATDQLANVGVENIISFQCNILEVFGEDKWAQ